MVHFYIVSEQFLSRFPLKRVLETLTKLELKALEKAVP